MANFYCQSIVPRNQPGPTVEVVQHLYPITVEEPATPSPHFTLLDNQPPPPLQLLAPANNQPTANQKPKHTPVLHQLVDSDVDSEHFTPPRRHPSVIDLEAEEVPVPRVLRGRPTPKPKPFIQKLRVKKDRLYRDRCQPKPRSRNVARSKRFCKLCDIQCNSAKTYFDHKQSRGHKTRLQNKRDPPFCKTCDRHFESHHHLNRHLNGKDHHKVLYHKNLNK